MKNLLTNDGKIRNTVGLATAATAITVLLVQAYRNTLNTAMVMANIGLLLVAGVFIVGGGAFTKLFKNWLNR